MAGDYEQSPADHNGGIKLACPKITIEVIDTPQRRVGILPTFIHTKLNAKARRHEQEE
ncbi:MAG TPA: hypothetical protein VGB55_10590 [Tepidisphaeraceae bacterium]|jgi:hypothetical protein